MDKKTIIEQINTLRKQKDVLILAHNYQNPGIQDIADHLGDSLELAKIASKTDVENIIFCGVVFMAESAKILNPDKNVIIPDITASCPMAAMVEAEPLRAKKEQHPDATVVAYINTTAEVKAESDICCTSSNGKKVVESVDAKEILFVPDINLGQYIKRFIDDKEMILWPGMCSTHHNITKEDIMKLKKIHPNSEILVHPECRPEIIDIADYAYSTNGMVNHVKKSDSDEFIIGTEKEMCLSLIHI